MPAHNGLHHRLEGNANKVVPKLLTSKADHKIQIGTVQILYLEQNSMFTIFRREHYFGKYCYSEGGIVEILLRMFL